MTILKHLRVLTVAVLVIAFFPWLLRGDDASERVWVWKTPGPSKAVYYYWLSDRTSYVPAFPGAGYPSLEALLTDLQKHFPRNNFTVCPGYPGSPTTSVVRLDAGDCAFLRYNLVELAK